MDGKARILPLAVLNGTRVRVRDKMIGDSQSGREAHTAGKAWETARVGKESCKKDGKSGEAVALYTSRKRRVGQGAALHPNGSRQTYSGTRLPGSRNRSPLRRPLLYKLKRINIVRLCTNA